MESKNRELIPLVSVIIPCYNQAQYLTEAVESVLWQSYLEWECIIIDDGSPDNTEEIALNLLRLDLRLQYYKKENGGISDARNFGIAKAKGKYILPLDADDKLENRYIELLIEEIERDEEVKVVYSDLEFIGERSGKWEFPQFSLPELARNNIIFCSALFRKSDWERVGGYDLNMRTGFEDWEFWINLLKSGGKVVKLPYIGFFYRIKNSSRNASIDGKNKFLLENYICKKHFDFIIQELGNPIYLSQELKRYKDSLDYISNKWPYRIYKKLKALF